MVPVKYGYCPTYTVIHQGVLNHRRHPSFGFIYLKYGHQLSILLTWGSDLLLLDDYPALIWMLWLATETLVNPTLTALLVEVTSLSITVKFSSFYSKGQSKLGTLKLCRLFEYGYVKLVHLNQPSVQNV